MRSTGDRAAGYVPISSYAALGDGRTVVLVAGDGRIDWWPLPTMDSPPGFAALLDAESGGSISLAPVSDFTVKRRYLEDTNVLETVFTTSTGSVRLIDTLCVGHGGRLPWTELVRSVEGLDGEVEMGWTVAPGTRFDSARPWAEFKRGTVMVHLGDQRLAVVSYDAGEPQTTLHQVKGGFTSRPGRRSLLVITSSDRSPVFLSERDEIESRVELTEHRWREWARTVRYDGEWPHQVRRSAIALKLLLYAPTGAIAAAPTTSLPERIGGDKNWDYRYAWIRDSSFTADALISLRLHEEVQAGVSWLLSTLERTAPNLHVFYKLDGRTADGEQILPAPGYKGSTPVRSGNGASTQSQLGTFGDLFDTVLRYVAAGHLLDTGTEEMLTALADRCCDIWMTKDSGIWELGRLEHYTISKMGCWVALDRAVRLAEMGEISDAHVERWRGERDEIHTWVDENCWSEEKNTYTMAAGSEDLDAATLLAARTGFDRGKRLAGTVEAVRSELGRGPMIYRYSGMQQQEGAFVACTFWLVEALSHLGRHDEARELLEQGLDFCNDVGLLSEQIDPDTREFLGNMPQGLSHLALINATVTVHRATAGQAR